MSYVEEHLMPGEKVMHRTSLHKIIFVPAVLLSLVFFAGSILSFSAEIFALGAVLIVMGIVPLVYARISYISSEFVVTDKRVIIKVGWIQRRTLETMLGKVEGIGVDQGVIGRLLDYGTIVVTGTGGTKEEFQNITAPLEFRRQVQAQVSATEELRFMPAGAGAPVGPPRQERECPYCAELILAKAKVCKHCGRDVTPLERT